MTMMALESKASMMLTALSVCLSAADAVAKDNAGAVVIG